MAVRRKGVMFVARPESAKQIAVKTDMRPGNKALGFESTKKNSSMPRFTWAAYSTRVSPEINKTPNDKIRDVALLYFPERFMKKIARPSIRNDRAVFTFMEARPGKTVVINDRSKIQARSTITATDTTIVLPILIAKSEELLRLSICFFHCPHAIASPSEGGTK